MNAVSGIIEALGADMMVILAAGCRVTEAVVKTVTFKIIGIARPDSIDILCVVCIKYTHTI
jgi:hypothetical protein